MGLAERLSLAFYFTYFRVSTESVVLTKATLGEEEWPLSPEVAWGMSSRGE